MAKTRMHAITKQGNINNIVEQWKSHWYVNDNEWRTPFGGFGDGLTSEDVYNRLLALNPPTEQGIIDIIGNDGWIEIRCDHCYEVVDTAVELHIAGCMYDVTICLACLQKAVTLFAADT